MSYKNVSLLKIKYFKETMNTNTSTIQNGQSRNVAIHTPTTPTQGQLQAWVAELGKSDGPRFPKVEESDKLFQAKGCETKTIKIGSGFIVNDSSMHFDGKHFYYNRARHDGTTYRDIISSRSSDKY